MRGENGQAFRVRGLDRRQRSAPEFGRQQPHQRGNALRRQVFHHLGAKNSAQRTVLDGREVGEQVRLLGRQSFGAAERDAFRALIDAPRAQTGFARGLQKLSPAAAEIEDFMRGTFP